MKHLKTSAQELRELFDNVITVRTIAEYLTSFDEKAEASEIREFIEKKDYDVVGVKKNGVIAGYVNKKDLQEGTLEKYLQNFTTSDTITDTVPLIDAFEKISQSPESPRLFVEVLGHVSGIVTRGDLQKAPVRMWLFSLVTLVEMQFLRIIRNAYLDDEWKESLKQNRIEAAQRLLSIRQVRNEAIDLADCLQLFDKRDIILENKDVRTALGLENKKTAKKFLEKLERLRDEIAHGQDILTGNWPDLINLAIETEKVLKACENYQGCPN